MNVNQDIKRLRRIRQELDVLVSVKEKHEKKIRILSRMGTDAAEREIRRLSDFINDLKIPQLAKEKEELEEIYLPKIRSLPPLDHLIIEGFLDGGTYSKIALDLGYSEVGVRKRLSKIYCKLNIEK